MKPRLRLNIPLLPFLVFVLLVAEIMSPSKIWVMLLVGLGGAWLMGYVWARALSRNLRLTREVRYDWAQVGDRLEERFTIFNYSTFPASWVEVLDHSNIPGYQPTQAISIGGRSRYRRTMDGVC